MWNGTEWVRQMYDPNLSEPAAANGYAWPAVPPYDTSVYGRVMVNGPTHQAPWNKGCEDALIERDASKPYMPVLGAYVTGTRWGSDQKPDYSRLVATQNLDNRDMFDLSETSDGSGRVHVGTYVDPYTGEEFDEFEHAFEGVPKDQRMSKSGLDRAHELLSGELAIYTKPGETEPIDIEPDLLRERPEDLVRERGIRMAKLDYLTGRHHGEYPFVDADGYGGPQQFTIPSNVDGMRLDSVRGPWVPDAHLHRNISENDRETFQPRETVRGGVGDYSGWLKSQVAATDNQLAPRGAYAGDFTASDPRATSIRDAFRTQIVIDGETQAYWDDLSRGPMRTARNTDPVAGHFVSVLAGLGAHADGVSDPRGTDVSNRKRAQLSILDQLSGANVGADGNVRSIGEFAQKITNAAIAPITLDTQERAHGMDVSGGFYYEAREATKPTDFEFNRGAVDSSFAFGHGPSGYRDTWGDVGAQRANTAMPGMVGYSGAPEAPPTWDVQWVSSQMQYGRPTAVPESGFTPDFENPLGVPLDTEYVSKRG